MYWQEEGDEEFSVPDEVVDLVFSIDCPSLPVDHGQALYDALRNALPWFAEEPEAAPHTVHGAESGNGWIRPEGPGSLILLSRRTRLVLRLPKGRLPEAQRLTGQELSVAGQRMKVGHGSPRLLSRSTTLYARYVTFEPEQDEEAFMDSCIGELKGRGFRFKKILCGRSNLIAVDDGTFLARSVVIGDLPVGDGVRLQREGVGRWRKLGCGIFIAHKAV